MIIFVEGPDGCGKTHISHALSNHYGIPYFKVTTEKSNWINDCFTSSIPFDILLPEFVRQTDTAFVSDRCYISEIVYSDVYGRSTLSEPLNRIDSEWSEMGAIVVMCLRHDYSVVNDELVESHKLEALHNRYTRFYHQTNCHVIKIFVDDYDDDIERQLPQLTEKINLIRSLNSDSGVKVEL